MENFDQIEQLILNKSFEELSDDEKGLVLEVYSESEYTQVRAFMIDTAAYKKNVSIDLPENHKHDLMSAFVSERALNTKTWAERLSLFLFPVDKSFIQKPGFQMAFASIVVVFGIWIVGNINQDLIQDGSMAKLEEKVKPHSNKEAGEDNKQKAAPISDEMEEMPEGEIEMTGGVNDVQLEATEKEVMPDTTFGYASGFIADKITPSVPETSSSSDLDDDNLMNSITHLELLKGKETTTLVMDEEVTDAKYENVENTFMITQEPDLLDLLSAAY